MRFYIIQRTVTVAAHMPGVPAQNGVAELPKGTVVGMVDPAFGEGDTHTVILASDFRMVVDKDLFYLNGYIDSVTAGLMRYEIPQGEWLCILPTLCELCRQPRPFHASACDAQRRLGERT